MALHFGEFFGCRFCHLFSWPVWSLSVWQSDICATSLLVNIAKMSARTERIQRPDLHFISLIVVGAWEPLGTWTLQNPQWWTSSQRRFHHRIQISRHCTASKEPIESQSTFQKLGKLFCLADCKVCCKKCCRNLRVRPVWCESGTTPLNDLLVQSRAIACDIQSRRVNGLPAEQPNLPSCFLQETMPCWMTCF